MKLNFYNRSFLAISQVFLRILFIPIYVYKPYLATIFIILIFRGQLPNAGYQTPQQRFDEGAFQTL